ncbi:MAG: hypothetical protein R2852_05575 [Bacteroidia bacterium]
MFQKYIKILVIVLLVSCKSEVFNFPDTPVLSIEKPAEQYKLNGKDSLVRLIIKYTDGDGNIGLDLSDTFPPFNYPNKFFYNLYINVYSVEDGIGKPIIIPLTTDTLNYNDRITNITPTGKNKSIYGELTINLKAEPYPGVQPDSMYYTVQIADRSLNLSNIVQTRTMSFVY